MVTKKTTRKKTKRKVAGRKATKKGFPGWVILLSGMLFGLIIAAFGYLNGWVPKVEENNKPKPQVSQTQSRPKIEDKSEELKKQPKYDFYEVLQDMEVVITDEEIQKTENRVPSKYLLQLSSFKNLKDAEGLKAQIAFTGQIAHIQSIKIKDTLWHRVLIGPIEGSRKADVTKRSLEKNGFNVLLLKDKSTQ
jgi:cell division protein FtsN